jgi:ABC-type lipoprotein export system ATPase subunit
MYRLTDVSRLYRRGRRTVPAVRDLSYTIDDGEWLAVQGRTGHGKTTLLEKLWREHHLTLVLITHDSAIARRAERTGRMTKGRLTVGR